MTTFDLAVRVLGSDLAFVALATGFLAIVAWAWRDAKPYELPKPLPDWFKLWFGSVQLLGLIPPLVALGWAVWQGYPQISILFGSYFIVLALQILSESLTLRQFRSIVWVMVPYLYVPYRVWQMAQGLILLSSQTDLVWIKGILLLELVVWTINYGLDLAQLPRLLRWEISSPE